MWPSTLSGRLPVTALVGHHPTNKLIGREPIPHRKHPKAQSFPNPPCDRPGIPRISPTFMRLSRRRGQVTHVLLTRSPLIHTHQKGKRFTVRLACVKHAASVRPEPGSNSPNKTNKTPTNPKTRANQSKASTKPRKPDQSPTQPQAKPRARQTKNKQPQETTHNQTSHAQPPRTKWHKKHNTLSSSQTTHPLETPRKTFVFRFPFQKRLRNFSDPIIWSQTMVR